MEKGVCTLGKKWARTLVLSQQSNYVLYFQEEIKRLKKELENFDPCFFEELEDLKFNYNQEVKRNILLEEQLKKLSEQFGMEIPGNVSID